MNALENVIEFFSPESALKRAKAKNTLNLVRKYEAASHGPRTKNWRAKATGANVEVGDSLEVIRSRSRQLHRDTAIAKRITEIIIANVVGDGVLAECSNSKVDEKIIDFLDTTEVDYDGLRDFYGLQNLFMRTFEQSGEVLVRTVYKSSYKYGVKFQILEPDFVDHTKNFTLKDGSYVVQGVVFRKDGTLKGYYIYKTHPKEYRYVRNQLLSEFRSAREYRLISNTERPGQVRGVPRISNVMLNIRDVSDTFNAELARRKLATCFAGYIYDPSGDTDLDSEDESEELSQVEAGTITKLKGSQQITFTNPPQTPDFSPFVVTQLRIIAMGVSVPYEALSYDLTGISFSGARIGRIDFNPMIRGIRRDILMNGFCWPVINTFKSMMFILGYSKEKDTYTLTPPVRELIDPVSENSSQKEEIRNGFNSLSEVIRSRGRDPKKVFKEIKDDFEMLDEMGIKVDCDPRNVTLAGNQTPDEDKNAKET